MLARKCSTLLICCWHLQVGGAPSKKMAEKVSAMCEEFSRQLQGKSLWFNAITYVLELGIIALEGERIEIDLSP